MTSDNLLSEKKIHINHDNLNTKPVKHRTESHTTDILMSEKKKVTTLRIRTHDTPNTSQMHVRISHWKSFTTRKDQQSRPKEYLIPSTSTSLQLALQLWKQTSTSFQQPLPNVYDDPPQAFKRLCGSQEGLAELHNPATGNVAVKPGCWSSTGSQQALQQSKQAW